jgi:hypothetical protein
VPQALSVLLNEHILPVAKRENSAQFRSTAMKDPIVKGALTQVRPQLKKWYTDLQHSNLSVDQDDKLSFDEWLKALRRPHPPNAERPRTDMCGEWEVEQLSEITGDPSSHGVHIKCRLSIPTCKAAFMDSQNVDQLGVGQAAEGSEQTVLDFDEWLECLARISVSKYSAIKQMDNSMKVKAFLQNFFGEMSEEDTMRSATYIRAVRYDLGDSVPLKDESPEEHAAFLAEFKQLQLDGLYGFPLWEAEVHDLLHANFRELASIFRGYCKSLGEGSGDESAKTMDIEEFHDFVIDVGLETVLKTNPAATPAVYNFEMMKEQFTKADKSGKGMAGPAANS